MTSLAIANERELVPPLVCPANDEQPVMDAVLDVEDVARLLRVGRNTVYELVKRNEIPSRRLGKQIRFSRGARERRPRSVAHDDGHHDDVLDAKGAMVLLKLGRNAVYDGCARGEIPHRRIGKLLRFSRAGLRDWLSSSISPSQPQARG